MKQPTDSTRSKSSLADISHLFLSSIRQKQTGNAAAPTRIPPAASRQAEPAIADGPSLKITPAETEDCQPASAGPPVRMLLSSHLGARHADGPQRYAASLAAAGQRVGLIRIDADELHLSTFDPHVSTPDNHQAQQISAADGRKLGECLSELSADLSVWIICPTNPKSAEAKELLRLADKWVLLSACDDEAVVASYRLLKGLAGEHRAGLSLAALDAEGCARADAMHRRLAGVCRQFLNLGLEAERPVAATPVVAEVPILSCAGGGKATAHWRVVCDLIASAPKNSTAQALQDEAEMKLVADKETIAPMKEQSEAPAPALNAIPMYESKAPGQLAEVLEVDDSGEAGVIEAVLKHLAGALIQCPVRAPMLPEGRITVSRDRRLVLVASAGPGLAQLRDVARAYRWLCDNRPLVAMALPQFSLDAERSPLLRLLIDYRDMHAGELAQLLRCDTVCIDAYRKIKWGSRMGLLMEAA